MSSELVRGDGLFPPAAYARDDESSNAPNGPGCLAGASPRPAPLRAWVRVEAAAGGQIALDALGRRILGVSPGDTVEARHLPMPAIPGRLVSG